MSPALFEFDLGFHEVGGAGVAGGDAEFWDGFVFSVSAFSLEEGFVGGELVRLQDLEVVAKFPLGGYVAGSELFDLEFELLVEAVAAVDAIGGVAVVAYGDEDLGFGTLGLDAKGAAEAVVAFVFPDGAFFSEGEVGPVVGVELGGDDGLAVWAAVVVDGDDGVDGAVVGDADGSVEGFDGGVVVKHSVAVEVDGIAFAEDFLGVAEFVAEDEDFALEEGDGVGVASDEAVASAVSGHGEEAELGGGITPAFAAARKDGLAVGGDDFSVSDDPVGVVVVGASGEPVAGGVHVGVEELVVADGAGESGAGNGFAVSEDDFSIDGDDLFG